jgi:hypothetical protein
MLLSQDVLTIREVFDFNINDEFHFIDNEGIRPPNAERIKVIEKYTSVNNDTIFYKLYYDTYSSVYHEKIDDLVYHFGTSNKDVYYTNLDSSVYCYYDFLNYNKLLEQQMSDSSFIFDYDSIQYLNEELCDAQVDGVWARIGEFEPNYFHAEFCKGLGIIFDEYVELSSGSSLPLYSKKLFYYKKGNLSCGVPDSTTNTGLHGQYVVDEIGIYPNPTSERITIISSDNPKSKLVTLSNISGQILIRSRMSDNFLTMDLSTLKPGIYFLSVSMDTKLITRKIIKN